MEISQVGLAVFLAAAVVCGAFLGAVYDMTAILPALCGKVFSYKIYQKLADITLPLIKRSLKPKKRKFGNAAKTTALFIHDLMFMITAGAITALLVYRCNDGKWRVGALLCMVFGFVLYRCTLRRPILWITEIIRFVIKCLVAYTVFLLVVPAVTIARKFGGLIRKLFNKFNVRKLERHIIKYSTKETEKLLNEASKGFLGVLVTGEGKLNERRKKKKQNNSMDNDTAVGRVGDNSGGKPYAVQPAKKRSRKAGAGAACT